MFKKNQKVFYISAWDDKATVRIIPAIVEACGKKQMTLRAEDGAMLGNNFRPQECQNGSRMDRAPVSLVLAADAFASREEIEARALVQAAYFRELQIEHYEERAAHSSTNVHYIASMEKSLAEVRAAAPAFVWRGEAK